MSEVANKSNKIRYSITSSDGNLKSKPQVNDDESYNYYELENSQTNYLEILGWCKKLKIFDNKFITGIENNLNMTFSDKFKLIFKTIEKNRKSLGQEKLKIFENILKNVLLLDDPVLNEYKDKLPNHEHLDKFDVQKTTHPTINCSIVSAYPMSSKNRGVLFFVNMINFPLDTKNIRRGAEYDKIYMIQLFREYGFTIYYYEDLLATTFWKLINRLIHQYLDGTDSLVFALATHGNISNDAQFYYDQSLNINDIVYKFNDLNCPAMYGKPKILLFPFCRGLKPDVGVQRHSLQTDNFNVKPSFSDLLICYATVHGYAALRDDNFGTWYIEAFCKVFAQYGHTHDIESMLRLIVNEINKMNKKCNEVKLKQNKTCIFLTPSFVRRDFNKLLFFNPGYVEKVLVQHK